MANGTERAIKAWKTRKIKEAWIKAHASEAASKAAFKRYMQKRGWRVGFFEGPTGSPRTGIVDAIAFRISRKNSDTLDLRLVQLKGGKAGVTAAEIGRLKAAIGRVETNWLIAAFDGEALHIVPSID